jgi:hypothetical protein
VNEVVQHGQVLLTEKLKAGEDLSTGPCLDDGERYREWAIDIAHNPRTPEDDDPNNQCGSYTRGRAERLVELSLSGDIIRIIPPIETQTPEEQLPGEPPAPSVMDAEEEVPAETEETEEDAPQEADETEETPAVEANDEPSEPETEPET